MAQEWYCLEARIVAPFNCTSKGLFLFSALFRPRFPMPLKPQHLSFPDSTAQECARPAETVCTPVAQVADFGRNELVDEIARAELPVLILAPALGDAVRDSAAVECACGNGSDHALRAR